MRRELGPGHGVSLGDGGAERRRGAGLGPVSRTMVRYWSRIPAVTRRPVAVRPLDAHLGRSSHRPGRSGSAQLAAGVPAAHGELAGLDPVAGADLDPGADGIRVRCRPAARSRRQPVAHGLGALRGCRHPRCARLHRRRSRRPRRGRAARRRLRSTSAAPRPSSKLQESRPAWPVRERAVRPLPRNRSMGSFMA